MEAGTSTIAFVTSSVPFSTGEEVFVQDELAAMLSVHPDLVVVPAVLRRAEPNDASRASGLAERTIAVGLMSAPVLRGALQTLVRRPIRCVTIVGRALVRSGSLRNLAVNAASVPKALWLAGQLERVGVAHVHAYWLSHTATIAMIASDLAGITWSASGFRWDVAAANALGPKLSSARFVRVADSLAASELDVARPKVPGACPVELIRTGVAVPAVDLGASAPPVSTTVLCCPGAFVPKKGHLVLLRAIATLVVRHPELHLHLFGDGPLRAEITQSIADLGLGGHVTMHGTVPLDELRRFLADVRPVCVLPSIRAADGQVEGIPVSLVEAMALGSPVISTRSGSIAELVVAGTGLLVEPGDAGDLARAVERLVDDGRLAAELAAAAHARVMDEFEIARTSTVLVRRCLDAAGDEQRRRRGELADSYRSLQDPEYAQRWSVENPGNVAIVHELRAAIDDLTAGWRSGRDAVTLLDLGCGHSSLVGARLEELSSGDGLRVGVDLLLERLVAGRASGLASSLVCADGAALPLPDASVDLVAMFTMMSSVLDPTVRSRIAGEVERVLRPGGAVLWYDMRMPNPRNEHTVALGRRDVGALLPTLSPTWRSLTVLPPLARRLGRFTDRAYPLVARVPLVRSHLLGLLVKS
jgi:glycosyltransferase involved in cell wall biosynthesis